MKSFGVLHHDYHMIHWGVALAVALPILYVLVFVGRRPKGCPPGTVGRDSMSWMTLTDCQGHRLSQCSVISTNCPKRTSTWHINDGGRSVCLRLHDAARTLTASRWAHILATAWPTDGHRPGKWIHGQSAHGQAQRQLRRPAETVHARHLGRFTNHHERVSTSRDQPTNTFF